MEDNIQTIIIVVISVVLLFIFPVYMAYEKKDDISYALAMRYTQDLVDEVRSKGYITKYMYDDYRAKLKVTGNSYDINMTHEYNRYDPITKYYTIDESGKYVLVKTTTQEEKEDIIEQGILEGIINEKSTNQEKDAYIASIYGFDQLENTRLYSEDTYQISKQVYTTEHIQSILNSERKLLLNASATSNTETVSCKDNEECQYAYIMNVDDNFNVTIKNTNTTLATVIYNMVTANALEESTRIYVNYGGSILSSKWQGNIDYAKMDHEGITLDKLTVIERLAIEQFYEESKADENVIYELQEKYDGEYAIEFNVKPTDVTVLRKKGPNNTGDYPVNNYAAYNFAIGNNKPLDNNSTLSISVGLNGISLVTNTALKRAASTITPFTDFATYEIPYSTTCPDTEEYLCTDDITGEEKTCTREIEVPCTKYNTYQRKITDYKELILTCTTKGKINVTLKGNTASIPNVTGIIEVKDENGILVGLSAKIENPTAGLLYGNFGETIIRGTNVNYTIDIQERNISIYAHQDISNEMTILSYPVAIEDYVKVRVDIREKEELEGIYNAVLYLNGEMVDESIDMNYIPKVNCVGMTTIGNEQPKYFDGHIKNVKLYN